MFVMALLELNALLLSGCPDVISDNGKGEKYDEGFVQGSILVCPRILEVV